MSRKLRHRSHHGHHEGSEPAPDHNQEIELLAYQYWEERGSPVGSPEEDWFKAEAHLLAEEEAAQHL